MNSKIKIHGFHLLEMLAVLCLVSILGLVGYSTYSHYVLKAARLQAEITLGELSMELERHYLTHHIYEATPLPQSHTNKHYAIEFTYIDAEHYQLTAHPISSLAKEHTCGALLLNELGEKQITGHAQVNDCW